MITHYILCSAWISGSRFEKPRWTSALILSDLILILISEEKHSDGYKVQKGITNMIQLWVLRFWHLWNLGELDECYWLFLRKRAHTNSLSPVGMHLRGPQLVWSHPGTQVRISNLDIVQVRGERNQHLLTIFTQLSFHNHSHLLYR